MKLIYIRAQKL